VRLRSLLMFLILCIVLCAVVSSQVLETRAATFTLLALVRPHTSAAPPAPSDIRLDSRLPVQTLRSDAHFTNYNVTFGSRFDFAISPGAARVRSGTDGVYHDNAASYVVGVMPAGQPETFMFHMGALNRARGDAYLSNERWIQGLDATRWMAEVPGDATMHVVVDFIAAFQGEPGCTAIADCAEAVKDDTMPALIVGVSLQNASYSRRQGVFLFGSNRRLPASGGCSQHTTPGGAAVSAVTYAPSADAPAGTLFLAGDLAHWTCSTQQTDRAGLTWSYSVGAMQTQTAYLVLGGWNASQQLLVNTKLPASCQGEGLFAASEWPSANAVMDFAIDNISTRDDLLVRAQSLEDYLIQNDVLTPQQRWLIGDTLRSYKASSWLLARQACAGGGYDAAVYEGSYGFLTTVDVMHEYGYFEINRVPWFFKAALSMVFANATRDGAGLYFQHDQGGDIDSNGLCTAPGEGVPTFRASCYAPPYVDMGAPMPTEENDDVALLTAYYEFVTGDTSFLRQHIGQIDAAMLHNINVGDPATGIAYRSHDTNTTYDAAGDCLHNDAPGSGNLYYQALKEATGYRATAYLDALIPGDGNARAWNDAASRIESAMVREYSSNGFLPVAANNTFSNCAGRSITLGEGLFYLHLIGQDGNMNQQLLTDLAQQYPTDMAASTLAQPSMIAMTSLPATGSQCAGGNCRQYSWFSKVMLSALVADFIYTARGCASCARLDVVQAAYNQNVNNAGNFVDGMHDDGSDWNGYTYPRGIISWAWLSPEY
jgi:hypothetical protein